MLEVLGGCRVAEPCWKSRGPAEATLDGALTGFWTISGRTEKGLSGASRLTGFDFEIPQKASQLELTARVNAPEHPDLNLRFAKLTA
jgi:hypothetical protein